MTGAIRTAAVAAAIAAAAPACKVRNNNDLAEASAKFREFTSRVCACKDKACAEVVQAEMNRWGQEMAQHSGKQAKPSEAEVKEITALSESFSKCMTSVMGVGSGTGSGTGSGSALEARPDEPLQIDAQVKVARQRAARHARKLAMSKLEVSYARADGTLDPQYGKLEVDFSEPPTPPPADDPNRPIGAPVPAPRTGPLGMDCPSWTLEAGEWHETKSFCLAMASLMPPRCTITQVWARAIADKAPAAALAALSLHEGEPGSPQQWRFSISDPPRDIDFQKAYPDDCEPVLEKPAPK